MCGIIGGVDPPDGIRDRAERARLRDLLKHRGPDGEGLWEDDDRTWWLGHRRLSIIDLSDAGAQPMATPDGRFHLTYNGEMYNYPDIRKELAQTGTAFRGESDTEVALHLLARDGLGGLSEFRGMFALGLLDQTRDQIFLARDRIGQKPLYYWISEDRRRFRFASELKAIAEDPVVDPVLDPLALEDYIAFQYTPSPSTIYRNIHKVRPGHSVVVSRQADGTLVEKMAPYWALSFSPDHSLTEAAALEELEWRLEEAVRLRLVSDVPLGAFLSGGVDSSLIVAMMARIMKEPVQTFTIGFAEADYSELPFASAVAGHVGSLHTERILSPDAIDLLPRLVAQYDEPFGDSSALPMYLVSQVARERVTVSLSGDAGDELFAGYQSYVSMLQAERYNWLPKPLWKTLSRLTPESNVRRKRFELMQLRTGVRNTELMSGFPCWERPGLFTPSFQERLLQERKARNVTPPSERFLDSFDEPPPSATYLDRLQNQDIHTYLTDDILTKVDRASMMTSLEVRCPMLDHPFVEFAARIPAAVRKPGRETKHLLKTLARRLLPAGVVDRPKQGFSVPLQHWFRNSLLSYAEEHLLHPESATRSILNPDRVRHTIARHQKSGRDFSGQIWNLLFLEHWCRQHPTALRQLD